MNNGIAANNALVYLTTALNHYPNEDLEKEINEVKDQNEKRKYIVAVAGDFKRGKSSLVNALLGMPVLPMGIEPMTATLNRIIWGFHPRVLIKKRDGTIEQIPMNELSDYVTQKDMATARSIEEAVIEYPTELCRNGIDILDTPGLNDSEEMTLITGSALNSVHAAIVAVSATLLFSDSEADWVADLIALERLEYLIFAVTFIDEIADSKRPRVLNYFRERIPKAVWAHVERKYADREAVMEKAKRLLKPDSLVLITVSPRDALDAFVSGDDELLRASNLPEFKKQLMTLLVAQQEEYVLRKTRQLAQRTQDWIIRCDDRKMEHGQECEVALNLLKAYPETVKKEIAAMVSKLKEAVSGREDAYNAMKECVDRILARESVNVHTNEDAHGLLKNVTEEVRDEAKFFYRKEWESLAAILEEGEGNILEAHRVLARYCEVLDKVPVLLSDEALKAGLSEAVIDVLPRLEPAWTLDESKGMMDNMTTAAEGIGRRLGSLGLEVSENGQISRTLGRVGGFFRNSGIRGRAEDALSRVNEMTRTNLANKNLSEVIEPKLAQAATELDNQWKKNMPEHVERAFCRIFIETENLESNSELRIALERRAGEMKAKSAGKRESYEEALRYVRKAQAAVSDRALL